MEPIRPGTAQITGLIEREVLPARVYNALVRSYVFGVEDLATRLRHDVLKINGIGKKGLAVIECYLAQKGISPREDRVW